MNDLVGAVSFTLNRRRYREGADPRGTIAIEYGLTGVPEKHFIDRGGRVVRKFVGPLSEERLAAILDDVLAIP